MGKLDRYHGQSGSYVVENGERVLVPGSVTVPHQDGDAPRDADGKRTDLPPEDAKPEPAIPAPVRPAWLPPVEEAPRPARTPRRTDPA